jgi:hypothetical protein
VLITLSAAFITGVIAVALVWGKKVSAGAGLFVWLSGFTTASTGLGSPINHIITAFLSAIAHR